MIANIQLADMNPIEEAQSYRRMRDDFGQSVRDISKQTGVYEKRIHDRFKLTNLEPEIQTYIARGMFPSSTSPVDALLLIPAGPERISLAKALAHHKASIGMIQRAVEKYLENKAARKIIEDTPALVLARQHALPRKGRPTWNALAQVGKLPPWKLLVEQSKATCHGCALADLANEKTCGECPHVDLLRRMLELANAE